MTKFNKNLEDKLKKLTEDIPKFDMSNIDTSKIDVNKVDTKNMKEVLDKVLNSLKQVSNFNFGDESDIKRAELLLKQVKKETTSVTNEIDERLKEATKPSSEDKDNEDDSESIDENVDTKE